MLSSSPAALRKALAAIRKRPDRPLFEVTNTELLEICDLAEKQLELREQVGQLKLSSGTQDPPAPVNKPNGRDLLASARQYLDTGESVAQVRSALYLVLTHLEQQTHKSK